MLKKNKLILGLGVGVFSFIGIIYLLFLILPFILTPFVKNYVPNVTSQIEKSLGLKTKLEGLNLITTPKLTVGVKLKNIEVYLPDNSLLFKGENLRAKMSLLPLIARNIEADVISADNLIAELRVKPDGHFLVEDIIPNEPDTDTSKENNIESANVPSSLPFGLKFSNHLPDIRIKKHNITFIDTKSGAKYSFSGENSNLYDFVLNKHFKLESKGEANLDGFKALTYDVKLYNKLMPDIEVNDIVLGNIEEEEQKEKIKTEFNIINSLKLIKTLQLHLDVVFDVDTDGTFDNPILDGNLTANNISALIKGKKLPSSNINLKFDKDGYKIDSTLYTAQNETTTIKGTYKGGKKPNIDLTCKSNATLKSLFELADAILQTAGINDLKTLSATGALDADFNIKSDFKTVNSNGYLKLNNGTVKYGLYDVNIDKIVSDILFNNNSVQIQKLGFSTLNIPFIIKGQISKDAIADITLSTSQMPVKGLLVSVGQSAILKENPVKSGTVTLNVNIKDKLLSPKINGNILLNNIDITNTPSSTRLVINPVNIDINTTQSGYTGNYSISGIKIFNPALNITSPLIKGNLDEKVINVSDSQVTFGLNKITLSGNIQDYLTDKISFSFNTKGSLNSTLKGKIDPYKMTGDIDFQIPNNSTVIIPGFNKSKLTLNGNATIQGNMANPNVKSRFNIPLVDIPEVIVVMKDMVVETQGPILNGNATVQEFKSGGIVGTDIKTDIKLKGNDFYLSNLKGSAFDGVFSGDIVYNLSNAFCKVKFSGQDMNATKAIEGAVGIKNALSGTLGFNTDLTLYVLDYDRMIKSMKGNINFDVKDGVLGNLGGLKTIMKAQNLLSDSILKAATGALTALPIIQQSSEFKYIKGDLNLNNGYANIKSINMAGPLMAYNISGMFNILNGSTNAVVLGRLSQKIVGSLGHIGQMATGKLTNAIPGIGALTSSLVKKMHISPKSVDTSKIPSLSSNEINYQEFKVDFNGGIDSDSSVKSFKWIGDVDTSELDANQAQLKESLDTAKKNIQNSINNAISDPKNLKQVGETAKEQAKELFNTFLGK